MKSRLLAMLLPAVAFLAACSGSDTQRYKDELVAADKAFSARSSKDGARAAFIATLASEGKMLGMRPGGSDGVAQVFMQLPATAMLTWEPAFVDVSSSGDLGYTWGRYTLIVPSPLKGTPPLVKMGDYVTLWKRQADGSWKAVLSGSSTNGQR